MASVVQDLLNSYFDFTHWYDLMHPLASRGPKRADPNALTTIRKFFHKCEGQGGKHYEPYEISTSSLCEGS